MKKGKLLSVLTSLAMTSSMVLSAVPATTATAAAANPLGLELTSAKTSYSVDEIKAGATATVYVDPVGSVSESDHVGSVEFKLKSSAWGKVDPIDLILTDENALGSSKGNLVKKNKPYNQLATNVISKWDDAEKPKKAGYAVQDYLNLGDFNGYSDDYRPAVMIMQDSTLGFLRTDPSYGQHIAEFQIKFPTDLAEGTYTISFEEAQSMICVDGEFGSNASENIASPVAKSITFTIGEGGSPIDTEPFVTTTAPITDPPTNTTPSPVTPVQGDVTMPENPVVTDPASLREYDADAYLKGDVVKGNAGDTVDVPVYLELGANADPKYITGIAFKADYDKSALELVDIYEPDDSSLSDGAFNASTETGNFLYSFTTDDITVDSQYPMCVFQFKVKDGAKDGVYPVHFTNHLEGDGHAVQIIHVQNSQRTTYYVPHVTDGAVVVGNSSQIITTVEPSDPGVREYDGDAYLKGDKVTGKPGETVDVPVYLELGANVDPKYITGIAYKAVYDSSALELVDIFEPDDSSLSDGAFNASTETGVLLYTYTTADITVDAQYPMAVFQFKIKDSAKAGTYDIDFINHLFGAGANLQIVHVQNQDKTTYLTPHVTKGAITVGGDVVTTTSGGSTDPGVRDYDGDAYLKGDTVKGKPGETVDVPVYLELGANVDPKYITGIAFKAVYDNSALELVDIFEPDDSSLSDGAFNASTETGVLLYTYTTGDITVDSQYPMAVFQFKIKDGAAAGTYDIDFINHLFGPGANLQIVHVQNQDKTTYLTPHVTKGAVIVEGDVVSTTSTAKEPIAEESTTTSISNSDPGVRDYDGDAYLKGDTVKGNRGEYVDVPVYLELGANVDPKYITGIAFKAVYDNAALELVDIFEPDDSSLSDGAFNASTETGVLLYTYTTADITVDPQYPMAVFRFKVKDTAADGIYDIDFINHLFGPGANLQIVHVQNQDKTTYLVPHVTKGAVIVGDGVTTPVVTTTSFADKPVDVTTTTVINTVPNPGSGEPQIVTQIVTETVVVTSIREVIITVPGEATTQIVTEYVTVPTIQTQIVTQTVIVTVPVIITDPQGPGTEPVPGSDPVSGSTTVSATDPSAVTTTEAVSISIVDDENHWYYADEDSWNLDQVKIFVNGKETTFNASDLTFSVDGNDGATPSNTYKTGTFDYQVTVSYKGASAEFDAKIGQRGDANCDHQVNVRDAAAIAKDLASLIKNKNKTTLTKEGGFGIFLGNSDAKTGGKEPYAPYDLNVRDAAVIAKYLSQKVAKPYQTLKDLAVK